MSAFHDLSERRSWALHQEVAARLLEHPEILERARLRVTNWLTDPTRHPYALAWQEILAQDATSIAAALAEVSPRMHTLRQASPFAGALDARTRWLILKRPELTGRAPQADSVGP